MSRANYRNGDEITLLCGCDGCSPLTVNGVLCHEQACPDAWRDYAKSCSECGCEFMRSARYQVICQDCFADKYSPWAFLDDTSLFMN